MAQQHRSTWTKPVLYGNEEPMESLTLSPALALTIIVLWPPCTVLNGDLVEATARELQQTGLVIHPKNTYGLHTGSILTYWEKLKDPSRHAQLMQVFLEKDTTHEKMAHANVVAIVFHRNCKIRVNDIPFQSSVLYSGKTKTYTFKSKDKWVPTPSNGEHYASIIPYEEGCPSPVKLQLGSSVVPLAMRFSHPVLGFGDTDKTTVNTSRRSSFPLFLRASIRKKSSDAVFVKNSSSLDTQRLHSNSTDFLQQTSGDHCKSPSSIDTAPDLLSPSSSSSLPRKRPLPLSSNMDSDSKKKAKGEIHTFQGGSHGDSIGCSFLPSCSTPCMPQPSGTDSSQLRIATSSLKSVELAAERERNQLEKTRLQEECAEVKREYERTKQAEQAALKMKNELENSTVKLRERLHRSEKACEDSLVRISTMRALLDDAESSKKLLQKTLQATEEECRRLRLREEEQLLALLEATKEAERVQNHNNSVDEAILKATSLSDEALRLAEECQKAAEQKQRMAEDALASERLRRIAAEETFLDIHTTLHGLHVSLSTGTTEATAKDVGRCATVRIE